MVHLNEPIVGLLGSTDELSIKKKVETDQNIVRNKIAID